MKISVRLLRRSAFALVIASVVSWSARNADAQGLSIAAGRGGSSGGNFAERGTYAGSIAFDHGRVLSNGIALAWRLGGTTAFHNGSDLTCAEAPGRVCAPLEPDLLAASGALGIRLGADRASLSLFAGPSLYGTKRYEEKRTSGVGLLFAGTGFLAVGKNIGISAAVEQHRVQFVDQNLQMTAFMLGLRFGPTAFPR